jgi:lysophospholipase L1-like esterase
MFRVSYRVWWFRLTAILLGLSVFPLAEGVCRVFDWGRPDEIDDPFVGFSDIHPLFVHNPEAEQYEIARSRLLFFKPDSFTSKKSATGFRIFCLGGSTVQGRPYTIETSFTNWLKMALRHFQPSREWEVVNCGGISYASYRLVPILRECLQHDPDLFIICTGHNEFLEDRQYHHIKSSPQWGGLLRQTSRLRTIALVRAQIFGNQVTSNERLSRHVLSDEVDAILDYQNGLNTYQRDEEWRQDVVRHYQSNLRRMISMASSAGVPVLLIQPCSNLKDTPPFKSEHRSDIRRDDLTRFHDLVTNARSNVRTNLPASIDLFEQAIAIDNTHALTQFELGQCYEAAHRTVDARRAFFAARENDICPLRMIEPLNESMRLVARETNVMFLSADDLLAAETDDGIPGDSVLVDHIHPSFHGHQLIAEAILRILSPKLKVLLPDDWERQARLTWKLYLADLDSLYFLRGQRSLEALSAWTQGKADGPPIRRTPTAGAGNSTRP